MLINRIPLKCYVKQIPWLLRLGLEGFGPLSSGIWAEEREGAEGGGNEPGVSLASQQGGSQPPKWGVQRVMDAAEILLDRARQAGFAEVAIVR